MPWKIGGNFEAAAVTCETNWQECVITVANYLWCEMVSDVVEYFAKDGIIWVLAIAVAFMMLIRIKYHRNMQVENIVLNKQMLSKIEYKIGDLELKVNILTYKVQYGTWPLPHRICNLNPKKLQKIRMTLSNPGDRNNWIKHVLLSPTESNMCTLYSNTFIPKTKLPKFFDIKQKHIPHRLQRDKLSTDCSSVEISKSISDQSVKMCSRRPRDPRPQNVSTKGSDSLSNSEDFTLQHQDVKVLPPVPDEINRQSLKLPSRQSDRCAMYSTNAKYSSRQKLADTVYKCKSFFKNLKYKNNYSRKASEASSSKTRRAKEFASFTTERRNKSSSGHATAKRKEMSDRKRITKIKDRRKAKDNRSTSANVASNAGAFPRKLVPVFPIIQAAHIVRSSRETLYKVRKRLHSLHNILHTYQHMAQSLKRQDSIKQISEISDASTPVESEIHGIREADENETNTNPENLQRVQSCRSIVNSSENFELDRLEGSLSSFAEYSSHTSKTYQYSSDVTSQNTYSKRDSRHDIMQKSVDTSDLPVFTIAEPYNCKQYSRLYGAVSQTPKDKTEREEDARKYISNRSNNHELESRLKVNRDVIKTNILFNFKEKVPEVMSKKICYVLSPELFKDKNTKTRNEMFLMEKFDSDQLSDTFDAKQSEESIISRNSSRSKMPSDSEGKEKSIALLLQEALHFKKTLLTRSREKCPMSGVKQIDVADELPECETQIKSNNFPPMILDIKAKEPIADYSHNRINQCYISLGMKQRRDLFSKSSQNANTFPRHQSHRKDAEEQNYISEIPSEYFSIADLAIYKNDNIENNVLLSSTPPIYEKMISIAVPNNKVESPDEIDTNTKSIRGKAMLKSIPNHVNSDSLEESTIHNNIIDKYLSILKLENLISEQVQNIKDYMGIFLQNQNRTISKTCKELRCQGESDNFLCSSSQNHIVLYDRSIASSSCNDINRVANLSKDLPDLSMNTWLNYKNDIKERSSDTRLKKNPEMFALIAPIRNTSPDKNDAQLKRKGTDLSLPTDSSTSKVAKCETPCSKERITPNTKNDTLNKQTSVDANFRKYGKQTQTVGNGFSAVSCFPLSNTDPEEKDY